MGSLDYPEKHLIRLVGTQLGETTVLCQAALGPPAGTLQGFDLVFIGVHQRSQLVESENNVGPKVVLNLHRDLWGEAVFGTIQMRTEIHPVFVNPGQARLARISG